MTGVMAPTEAELLIEQATSLHREYLALVAQANAVLRRRNVAIMNLVDRDDVNKVRAAQELDISRQRLYELAHQTRKTAGE